MKRMVRQLMYYSVELQIERSTEKSKRRYHSKIAVVFEGRVDVGYEAPHLPLAALVIGLTIAGQEVPTHFWLTAVIDFLQLLIDSLAGSQLQ